MTTPCQKRVEEVEVLGIEDQVWFLESMKAEEAVQRILSIVDKRGGFPPFLVAWASRMLIGQWMITNSRQSA